MLPYSRQEISEEDIDSVFEVLKSDFLTQGPKVGQFEKLVSSYCGASHAAAVNSATSALHIACLALGLGPKDWLWTSPISFVASANCARYCGAKVDFVDIDPHTYNMSLEALSNKLEIAEKIGKLPKIVIPVHYAGQPCDMSKISELSKRYKFKIIEDASHAIGSSYKNDKIGSCVYSDITIFSFHPVKIITTGEGGILLTNSEKIVNQLYRLRTSGNTYDKNIMTDNPKNEIWNYQQIELGYNYRMNDIQAALGISQMKKLDEFITKRHKIAKIYDSSLSNLPIIIPQQSSDSFSSYHLYPIQIKNENNKITRNEMYNHLLRNNIKVNIHYAPIYLQPYYQKMNFRRGYCPNAEAFFKSTISIPIFPGMNLEDQYNVINTITEMFEK